MFEIFKEMNAEQKKAFIQKKAKETLVGIVLLIAMFAYVLA